MYTFKVELSATLAELKTKTFDNLRRQEQMSEKYLVILRRE